MSPHSLNPSFWLSLVCLLAFTSPGRAASQAPGAERPRWGEEPVVTLSARRGEMVLNGLWQFMPAVGKPESAGDPAWGLIWVPGSWKPNSKLPNLSRRGEGPAWQGYGDGSALARAWYRRPLRVPEAWKGRAILLDLQMVSTDAKVYVNGALCGRVRWPGGIVDITQAVRPGQEDLLLIDVAATAEEASADQALDAAVDRPLVIADPEGKALQTRGITGDVVLTSRPLGPHISDVFVETSVRRKELALQVDLRDVRLNGSATVTARLLDEQGKEEKRFQQEAHVGALHAQTLKLVWPWTDPRLWDEGQPNLYTLMLEVKGSGVDDEVAQRFGFREFWVEGRRVYLNGVEFRMRPWTSAAAGEWSDVGAYRPAIANQIDAGRALGFNIQEIWPEDQGQRGRYQAWAHWYDIADTKGWPMIGKAWSAMPYIRPGATPGWAELKERYREAMAADLRRYRNHPSIVMWVLDANAYGYVTDQSPLNLGRKKGLDTESWWYRNATLHGMESVEMVKAEDPTRPVITHHGAYVGDMHTCNTYLCLQPLQEREEWVTAWARDADLPFVAIEFGTPLFTSFLRSRDGFESAIHSEPWATEYEATYLGSRAYEMETDAYRQEIRDRYDPEHSLGDQSYPRTWHGSPALVHSPGMQEIESLFITNTWRSWRTLGITGGMNPWEMANSFAEERQSEVPLPPFVPGTRGTYRSSLRPFSLYGYDARGGVKLLPGAQALVENNGPTLAWIAGPPGAATAKDHHFLPGRPVEKQAVLLNDTRRSQPFSFIWQVTVDGGPGESGGTSGVIPPGATRFFPISFTTPATIVGDRVEGRIELEARIGEHRHRDVFTFHVYQSPSPARATVQVFDPAGKTTTLLRSLGYIPRPWDGTAGTGLLVVGREALSSGAEAPGDLAGYVRSGGRVVIMEQDPEWLRSSLGFRVARHVARRAFPVPNHPAARGLDAEDLRDWNGESTLLPAYFETPMEVQNATPAYPRWGWHWGNRGGISSAAVEKPHWGAWRPILECEFDLAYSPLMELSCGRGLLILCTLDLEDHAGIDPAAARVARQMMAYAEAVRPAPRAARVVAIGSDTALLDQMGLVCDKATTLDSDADVVVVTRGAKVDEVALTGFLERGGKALILAGQEPKSPLGVTLKEVKDFGGATRPPAWPECSGLSASDLHWRARKDAWVVAEGAEVAAGGLLGRKSVGQGVALFCQADPSALEADRYTYFRFTRWRQTRLIAQLLTNLGARFQTDDLVLRPFPRVVSLEGTWRATITHKLPEGKRVEDPGVSDAARQALDPSADDSAWQEVAVPNNWAAYGEEWAKMNGEAVFRKVLDLPAAWAGKDLHLDLGGVDDLDIVYLNGTQVGASPPTVPSGSLPKRYYTIPGTLVKAGRNVLAVRVWDREFSGGLRGDGSPRPPSGEMRLAVNLYYHPDYRRDYELGDDPYRYYRW